jgi:hypothetical protein
LSLSTSSWIRSVACDILFSSFLFDFASESVCPCFRPPFLHRLLSCCRGIRRMGMQTFPSGSLPAQKKQEMMAAWAAGSFLPARRHCMTACKIAPYRHKKSQKA